MQYHDANPPKATDSDVLAPKSNGERAHEARKRAHKQVEDLVWYFLREFGRKQSKKVLVLAVAQELVFNQKTIQEHLDELTSIAPSAPFVLTFDDPDDPCIEPKDHNDPRLLADDAVGAPQQTTTTPPPAPKRRKGAGNV